METKNGESVKTRKIKIKAVSPIGGNLTSHTPAHNLLLPLLPSGPGGVHRSLLRGDRLDHHRGLQSLNTSQEARIINIFREQCKAKMFNFALHLSKLLYCSIKIQLLKITLLVLIVFQLDGSVDGLLQCYLKQ